MKTKFVEHKYMSLSALERFCSIGTCSSTCLIAGTYHSSRLQNIEFFLPLHMSNMVCILAVSTASWEWA